MAFFDDITALATLEAAWEKVRGNAGAAGGDGETVDEFAPRRRRVCGPCTGMCDRGF